MLKGKVLKLLEVVSQHLLEENQYAADLEVNYNLFFSLPQQQGTANALRRAEPNSQEHALSGWLRIELIS